MNKKELNEFHKVSYGLHEQEWNTYLQKEENVYHSKTWFDKDTVDYWRHLRMYKTLAPLLDCSPKAKWLTIGDGRYGTNAHYLESKGVEAMATDISDALLKIGKEKGFIKCYKKENAECMSFHDMEYDFVLCKESYHHFPRPMLALYEMLRVARKAVVLIEPNDTSQRLKAKIKRFITRRVSDQSKLYANNYEESGNYVYTISRRELEKVALGVSYPYVAFKGLNDFYREGVEYEKADADSKLFRKAKSKIALKNWLCQLKVYDYDTLTAILFKESPNTNLQKALLDEGYKLIKLPLNPYIHKL